VPKEDVVDLVVSADEDYSHNTSLLQASKEEDSVCVGSIEIGGHVDQRKKTNGIQSIEHLVQRSSIQLSRLEFQVKSCLPIPTGRATITRFGAKVYCGSDIGKVARKDKLEPKLGALEERA